MSKNHQLGDAPVDPQYRKMMERVAAVLDEGFNGPKQGKDRDTGFVLLVFPFEEIEPGGSNRCNFISNGADRKDIVALFREMIARFEGQPEIGGHA